MAALPFLTNAERAPTAKRGALCILFMTTNRTDQNHVYHTQALGVQPT